MQNSTPDQAQILKLIENIYQFDRNEQLSGFSDILDVDRAVLQPHLAIAQQNLDRYIQAQAQLAHLQQILPYLNTIAMATDRSAHLSANAQALLQKYLPDRPPIQPQRPPALHLNPKSFEPIGLTPRESEILFYVAQGHENPAIGKTLNIHSTTVKTHVSNITKKLGATSRLAAVTIALKRIGLEVLNPV
jgi:DNA-binding NarL/FixJ family response regulator